MRHLLAAASLLVAFHAPASAAEEERAAREGAPAAEDPAPALGPIRDGALPKDPSVRKAWKDVLAEAQWADVWAPEWNHPVAKEDVAARLAVSLAALERAAKGTKNVELLLAVGVAARFAHNVDVPGDPAERGFAALRRAAQLAPKDARPVWLLGGSLCHGAHVPQGWAEVVKARELAKGTELPAGFWHEALFCASAGLMNAHVLEAWKALETLGAGTRYERAVAAQSRRAVASPSLDEEYPAEKAAWGKKERGLVVVTHGVCGFRFAVEGTQPLKLHPVKKGMCVAETYAGPFEGATQVHPGMFVFAKVLGEDDGRDALLDDFAPPDRRTEVKDFACAFPGCRVYAIANPAHYPDDGGGTALVVAFERDEPEFPGLVFEEPSAPDLPPGEVHYVSHLPRLGRFPGRIAYVVALDTAVSVEREARAAFRKFLAEFAAE